LFRTGRQEAICGESDKENSSSHQLDTGNGSGRSHSMSIGGYPILGELPPVSSEDGCGQQLALLSKIELDEPFGLPLEPGSILSIIQSVKHGDSFEALDIQPPKKPHNRLSDQYWSHSNYAISLYCPDRQRRITKRDPFLDYSRAGIQRLARDRPGRERRTRRVSRTEAL
jgi:hypothetical protein